MQVARDHGQILDGLGHVFGGFFGEGLCKALIALDALDAIEVDLVFVVPG